MADDISERNEARLQRAFQNAMRQVGELLDDPERVAAYNKHIDWLIELYQPPDADQNIRDHFQSLKMTSADKKNLETAGFSAERSYIDWAGINIDDKRIEYNDLRLGNRFSHDVDSSDLIEKIIIHEVWHGLISNHAGHIKKSDQDFSEDIKEKLSYCEEMACDAGADSTKTWPRMADWQEQKIKDKTNKMPSKDRYNLYQMTGKKIYELVSEYFQARQHGYYVQNDADSALSSKYGTDTEALLQEANDLRHHPDKNYKDIRYLEIRKAMENTHALQNFEYFIQKDARLEGETHPSDLYRYDNSILVTWNLADFRTNHYLDRIYDGYVPPVPSVADHAAEIVKPVKPPAEPPPRVAKKETIWDAFAHSLQSMFSRTGLPPAQKSLKNDQ